VPTGEQLLTFAVLLGMIVLFISNRLRYDLVALLGLLAAVAFGVVSIDRAFVGFGDPVVILVASVLVLSSAVGRSDVIGRVIRDIEPFMRSTGRQVTVLTLSVTVLSSFMKNIGALAIFLPIAVQVARRSGTPVSRLLMPMAFGSLMGGLVTLIGTSPNILVSRIRTELLGAPFGMFDFAPVGLCIVAAGFTLLAFGWRLLPGDRMGPASATEAFDIEPYLSEVRVPASSPLVDKTVADLEALGEDELAVVAIIRGENNRYIPAQHWTLFADDVLVLRSDPHILQAVVREARLDLAGSTTTAGHGPSKEVGVVEAVVTGVSRLVGHSAAEFHLRDRHGASLIAISRGGQSIQTHLRHVQLQPGDVLVLQGSLVALPKILKELGCLPLVDRATGLGQPRQDYLPLVLLALAIAAVAFDLVPVTAAFFTAAILVVLLRVLSLQEAYEAIDLPILVLIACLIPISDAVRSTGGADLIASGLAVVAATLPPVGAVSLALVAAMALTPFLSNAATVLIMAPIATSLAEKLSLGPDAFLMAVAIGAACDFLTPIGHQCNTLVMGPGGYRFGDYWRLGLPLSAIVVTVATVMIPLVWGVR
jgi:di/tricarboxylate transporter